jgi:cell division septal protein FtsQ
MAARKTTRRKTGTTKTAARRKRTSSSAARRTRKGPSKIVNFFVPMFFILCILFCLGFLFFMGYRTATASAFFDIEQVELSGVKNIKEERIRQIVRSHTAQTGVWNADLDAIKAEIGKFRYAREVSVSRVLPDTVRVIVNEREPVALVRLNGKDFWVDAEGLLLDRIAEGDERPPFVMTGWEESDTERSKEINKKRVELYLRLLDEWKAYDLISRVKILDLSDLRQTRAIIENSSRPVEIRIEGENYLKGLQKGIETVANSDGCVEYIITDGEKITKGECKS